MTILLNQTRPPALIPACVPGDVASAAIAQRQPATAIAQGQPATAIAQGQPATAIAQGQPAMAVELQQGRIPAAAGFHAQISLNSKIHNYMGTTSAKGEGMTLSIIEGRTASVERTKTVEVYKVMGGDARGIPPRGRPV